MYFILLLGTSPMGSPFSSPARRTGRKSAYTPGEEHWQGDDLFKDDLMTYEIDGVKTKVHLRKHPEMSRQKIDHFNRVRYGSTADGTSSYNLLLLPQYFVDHITPITAPGQVTQKPPSPLVLSQQEIFDKIMSLSLEQLFFTAGNVAERERNELFFNPQSPSNSPQRQRRNRKKRFEGHEDDAFSPSGKDGSLAEFSRITEEDGLASTSRYGVSFKDEIYHPRDVEKDREDENEEGERDEGAAAESLQAYDFVKKRRNARATVTQTM